NIKQSCSDSPAIANQMDGVFGTDSWSNRCSLSGVCYASSASSSTAACWPSSGMMRCAGCKYAPNIDPHLKFGPSSCYRADIPHGRGASTCTCRDPLMKRRKPYWIKRFDQRGRGLILRAILQHWHHGRADGRQPDQGRFTAAVWNRTRSKTDPLAVQGARVADGPVDCVKGADYILSILDSGPVVREVFFDSRAADAMKRGSVFIDM